MNEASKSQFSMFRAMIALAWVDDKLDDDEKQRIKVYIDNNKHLSEQQRQQLIEEIDHPIKLDDVWADITDIQDRAHLINMADTIFWEDGNMCHTEKEIYDKIRAKHIATLDEDFIREDIREYRQELEAQRERFNEDLKRKARGYTPTGRVINYIESFFN